VIKKNNKPSKNLLPSSG